MLPHTLIGDNAAEPASFSSTGLPADDLPGSVEWVDDRARADQAADDAEWAAAIDREADLVNRFVEAHGVALALDLAAGQLADPKWSAAWRDFVDSAAARVA